MPFSSPSIPCPAPPDASRTRPGQICAHLFLFARLYRLVRFVSAFFIILWANLQWKWLHLYFDQILQHLPPPPPTPPFFAIPRPFPIVFGLAFVLVCFIRAYFQDSCRIFFEPPNRAKSNSPISTSEITRVFLHHLEIDLDGISAPSYGKRSSPTAQMILSPFALRQILAVAIITVRTDRMAAISRLCLPSRPIVIMISFFKN